MSFSIALFQSVLIMVRLCVSITDPGGDIMQFVKYDSNGKRIPFDSPNYYLNRPYNEV